MTTMHPQINPQLFKAQFGEDKILWQVFRGKTDGFFIEVGAYNGVDLSNTFFLEQMGWRGILVEPILPLILSAEKYRPNSQTVHTACSYPGAPRFQQFTMAQNVPVLSYLQADEDHKQRCINEGATLVEVEVPVVPLDEVILTLKKQNSPKGNAWVPNKGWQIDLVSIDVEGGEIDVLKGFNLERFKPKVLLMENDREAGAEIEPYLNKLGYKKFHRQVINDFYVREDETTSDLKLAGFEEQ